MTPAWKKDEKTIRDIVMKNASPTQPQHKLRFIIYYKSPKSSSLIMRNDTSKPPKLKHTDVVYRFKCTTGDCETRNVHYIGHTTTTLSRRLTMHLQDGGPKKHLWTQHQAQLTRDLLTSNTDIIFRCHDKRRLETAETIFIRDTAPIINAQTKTLTNLPLFDRHLNSTTSSSNLNQHSQQDNTRRLTQDTSSTNQTQHSSSPTQHDTRSTSDDHATAQHTYQLRSSTQHATTSTSNSTTTQITPQHRQLRSSMHNTATSNQHRQQSSDTTQHNIRH